MLSDIVRNIARRHLAAGGDETAAELGRVPAGEAVRADAAPAAGREVESREWRVESENASSPFLSTLYSPLSTSSPGLDAHQETYVPRSPDAPPAPTGSAARADAAPTAGREVESREWRVESENASSPFLSTLYSPLSTSSPGLDAHQGAYVPRSPDAPPAPTGPAVRADAAPAGGDVESREWRVESENASSPFLSTLYSPLSTSFPGLDAHGETPRSPEQLAGRVDDGSRQVAQTIGDLEASLARLFQTQIDALQRLSERALEQERRWVALAALRRSTP